MLIPVLPVHCCNHIPVVVVYLAITSWVLPAILMPALMAPIVVGSTPVPYARVDVSLVPIPVLLVYPAILVCICTSSRACPVALRLLPCITSTRDSVSHANPSAHPAYPRPYNVHHALTHPCTSTRSPASAAYLAHPPTTLTLPQMPQNYA